MKLPPCFDKIWDDLEKRQTIPPIHLETLQTRLVIACGSKIQKPKRQPRGTTPRPRIDVRREFCQRRASNVYQEALEKRPDVFLPLVLSATPKFCEDFDVSQFCEDFATDRKLHLDQNAKRLLGDIAVKENIAESPRYLELVKTLFPPDSASEEERATNLHFDFVDLLNFLKHYQVNQTRMQMICTYSGEPLPFIDIDLGLSSGLKGKIEFSYELSVAFMHFVNNKRVEG